MRLFVFPSCRDNKRVDGDTDNDPPSLPTSACDFSIMDGRSRARWKFGLEISPNRFKFLIQVSEFTVAPFSSEEGRDIVIVGKLIKRTRERLEQT